MSRPSIEVCTHIDNTPEAVLSYIANVRNRPLYLPSLKSVTDIKENPAGAGTTWKWTWVSLGMEFEGTARCLKYEPGKRYSFKTEGGIDSTWTYEAQPDRNGTKLTIHVDYDVPEKARPRLPTEAIGEAMKNSEANQVLQNLKIILDR
jgi:carbon monoxide dehydrogenase subunit G